MCGGTCCSNGFIKDLDYQIAIGVLGDFNKVATTFADFEVGLFLGFIILGKVRIYT